MQTTFVRPRARKKTGAWFFLLCLAVVFSAAIPWPTAGANFYAGTSPANVPWTNGIVPYEFTNTLTAAEQETFLDGLREWELAGNVKFVPHTTQTNWILFSYNTNFLDYVAGGSYNPQMVTVSSLSRAQVCHEMGHSFGFNHENIRPDAANYITVLTNNIADEPDTIGLFTVDPSTVPYGNYDFESVMHLGWDFNSTDPGVLATLQPKPPYFPRYQYRMGNYCLSPGDRAALAYLYGPPAVPLTNVVTTTADVGPGSLRAAIYYATDHPGTTISFDIPTSDPGYSNGVFNIHLTGMLPPLVTDGTVIDGSTQPGFAGVPLIVVDASQILPETFTSDTFLIYSANNQIKNLAFTGFDWNGVTMIYADATNNTISGCWIGVDATGTNAAPNAFQGILIAAGASDNIIGGTNALARNVISGNAQYGIFITDTNTTGNRVFGNYIGTDSSGSTAVPNGKSGVFIGNSASGTVIGNTNSAGRNIISGNTEYGIYLTGTANNVISGNYIGTDVSGEGALGNQLSGIALYGGAQNVIGGTVVGAGNVLSGNANYGIDIANPVTTGNFVEGNLIGLDAAGINGIGNGNGFGGVLLDNGATGNTIGGTVAGARNVISGNNPAGVFFAGTTTSGNVVEGNYIGTDITGMYAVPNSLAGIYLPFGTPGNLIGGSTAGAGNVISGNFYGLYFANANTSGNWIEGNNIGADATGINPLPNYDGFIIFSGATNNFIGLKPDGSGRGNQIAFNYWDGVLVGDTNTAGISIRGNSIFSNGNLGIELVNDGNHFQNSPVITNAIGAGGNTMISGNLNSAANSAFTIDFYGNPADSSGEGQFYLGATSVTTDVSGNAGFSFTDSGANDSGQYISATATSISGDTSEFSAVVLATNAPSAQFTGNFFWNANGFNFSVTVQTNFNYRIQTTTNLANPGSWTDLTNFAATSSTVDFIDPTATNSTRFYRVVSP